jgi:hypothetical protein
MYQSGHGQSTLSRWSRVGRHFRTCGVVDRVVVAGMGCCFAGLHRMASMRFLQTSTCMKQLLGRPHIPEQGLLQVPGSVRAPKPRSIKKAMEGRETRTSSGCDPALSHIWFGSPITVASRLVAN